MIPALVLVLALAAAGLSHPLPNQEQVSAANVVPQTLTEVPTAQFVDKTEVAESPSVYSPIGQLLQANTAVPRVENKPLKVHQEQPNYAETPVLLPLQPLSAVPVREVGPVPRPVIVPAEAITSGRVVIAGVESVQQRSYRKDEVTGNPLPYEQVGDPVNYKPVEAQGVEHVQLKDQQTSIQQQGYTQVQYSPEPLIEEEVSPVNRLQQNVQNRDEHYQKVYNVPDNVQPAEIENLPNQVPVYVPVQTVQQPQVQQGHEKQAPYEEVKGNTEVLSQPAEHQYQVYSGQPIVVGNVENLASQQSTEYEEQAHNAQKPIQKQGEYQQVNSYTPVQNQEAVEQLCDENPEVEKQGSYQTQSVELQQQVQVVQQAVESQMPYQQVLQQGEPLEPAYEQQVYNVQPAIADQIQPLQAHLAESANQQQPFGVQPVVSDQVLSQVPHEQLVQQEAPAYIPEQISKSSEAENKKPYKNIQQQEVVNYETQTVHNYVEIASQHVPVHTLPVLTQSLSVIPIQE